MRRRLQESFHLSPAAASASMAGNGGFFATAFGNGHAHHHGLAGGSQIPTISVSVQTEPSLVNLNGNPNGLANTAALLGNGGVFQNGVSVNPNGGVAAAVSAASAVERGSGNYATLPHPHHHLQNIHVRMTLLYLPCDILT